MPTINDYSAFAFMLQGYQVAEQDIKSDDADVRYYGFVDAFGAGYIQEETTAGDAITWKYDKIAKGNFSTAWSARESGTYQQWDDEFK